MALMSVSDCWLSDGDVDDGGDGGGDDGAEGGGEGAADAGKSKDSLKSKPDSHLPTLFLNPFSLNYSVMINSLKRFIKKLPLLDIATCTQHQQSSKNS